MNAAHEQRIAQARQLVDLTRQAWHEAVAALVEAEAAAEHVTTLGGAPTPMRRVESSGSELKPRPLGQ